MKPLLKTIMALFTFLSASDAFCQPAEKEWTILVFMNADNNLEPFGFSDFAEMSTVGGSEKVNIIVQIDRFGGSDSYITTNPDWKGALRFKIEKGMELLPSTALSDIGETNMGDPKVLKDFIEWGMHEYPAKKFMLIIWDHGDGWRFFDNRKINLGKDIFDIYKKYINKNILGERNYEMMNKDMGPLLQAANPGLKKFQNGFSNDTSTPSQSINILQNQAYRGISHDETNSDVFYNREIQDCLLGLLNGRKLDVIGFDACLMSMVETGYAFRNVAQFMVGSEELEPGDGWNYSLWIRKLTEQPDLDARRLAEILIDSYKEAYPAKFDITLSATDLSIMEELANSISALSDGLIKNMSTEYKNIQEARKLCIPYAPKEGLHGIDLKTFLLHLYKKTGENEIKTLINQVIAVLDKIIIKSFAAPGRRYSETIRSFGSFGLSIYFPETKLLFDTDKRAENGYEESNKKYPVEFVGNHKWDNFLKEYYKFIKM